MYLHGALEIYLQNVRFANQCKEMSPCKKKKTRQASLKIKFVHSNSVNSEEVHLGKLHVRIPKSKHA